MANKKTKPVCKPYLKGKPLSKQVLKRGTRLLAFQIVFILFYLLLGASLSIGGAVLHVITSLVLIAVCGALVWMEGVKAGDEDVCAGQIAYGKQETGRTVTNEEKEKAFHPAKGFVTVLIAVLIPVLICLAYALMCKKDTYHLQNLPSWISSSAGEGDYLALRYYTETESIGLVGVLSLVVRTCIYPFLNMVSSTDFNARYVIDRLSPLLVIIPFLPYAFGYLTGPRQRAGIQDSINRNNAKAKRQRRKQEQRKAEREQKNRLI